MAESQEKVHSFFPPCYNACTKARRVTLARRAGAYKSEKRKKEVSRQKKQEEKRQRRLSKGVGAQKDIEIIESEDKDKEQQN